MQYVDEAQRGTPAAPKRGARRMSAAEKYQMEAEAKGFDVSQARLERLRKGQSNPGNN